MNVLRARANFVSSVGGSTTMSSDKTNNAKYLDVDI